MTSLAVQVLAALALGLAAGLVVHQYPAPALVRLTDFIEPIGILWVNAIRMTVIPLIVSLVITGVASSTGMRDLRGIGVRTLVAFVGLLVLVAAVSLLMVPVLFVGLNVDPAAAQSARSALGGSASLAAAGVPGFAEWITGIIPANPIKAAADGAVLPLVVFTLLLALALLTLPADRRDPVVAFFRGLGDAMLAIVRVVIRLSPIGVFALMLPLARRTGGSVAGAIGYYVAVMSIGQLVMTGLLYPVAAFFGGVGVSRFARGRLSGTGGRVQLELLACVAAGAHRWRQSPARSSRARLRRRSSSGGIYVQDRAAADVGHGRRVPRTFLRHLADAAAAGHDCVDGDPHELQHAWRSARLAARDHAAHRADGHSA